MPKTAARRAAAVAVLALAVVGALTACEGQPIAAPAAGPVVMAIGDATSVPPPPAEQPAQAQQPQTPAQQSRPQPKQETASRPRKPAPWLGPRAAERSRRCERTLADMVRGSSSCPLGPTLPRQHKLRALRTTSPV